MPYKDKTKVAKAMRRYRERKRKEREEVLEKLHAIPGFLDLSKEEQRAIEKIVFEALAYVDVRLSKMEEEANQLIKLQIQVMYNRALEMVKHAKELKQLTIKKVDEELKK